MSDIKLWGQKAMVIVLVGMLMLAGCGRPATAPGPDQAAARASVTPAAEVAPASAETPTPAPAIELPPVVVDIDPERGEEQAVEAPIRVRFDQMMDPTSTQAAFSIEPATPGAVAVLGSDLVFTPSEPFARGSSYEVTVADTARSASGKLLAAPVQFRFETVGFLAVTSTQPADGSVEVAVDSPITVVFNRPVVPLTGIGQLGELPQPLVIDPPVPGQGEWLNTSIYTFRPEQALPGATEIRGTVPAGLQDITGGLLAEDYQFTFTTASPLVIGIEPGGTNISPRTAVTVTFSQPMDQATAEEAFVLSKAGEEAPVAGVFTWPDGQRVMRFQPAVDLAFATGYQARVDTTARSASGVGFLREEFVGVFDVAPRIAIVETEPADGESGVSTEAGLQVVFQGVVNEKTLGREAFTVIPEPTSVYSYYNSYENRWLINWPLQPQTGYTVTLSGEIADVFGNTLGQDQTVRFSTGDRKAFAHLNVPNEVGTYNVYTNTVIAASYRNVSSLGFKLYTVSEAEAERLLGPNRWETMQDFRPRSDALIREWSVPVSPPRNENVLQKIPLADDGGSLPAGMYWVEMRAPEVRYAEGDVLGDQTVPRHLLIVSPLNLVAKKTGTEILVWAVDLQSGQPVPELAVRVADQAGAQGSTDQDGIFRAPIKQVESWQPLVVFAGSQGNQFGAVSTEWQNGLGPWDFNLPSEFPAPEWQAYFYTDRPLYRPGQTVHWKGILRADDDAIYSVPPPGTKLDVTIRNSEGEAIYQQTHETNGFGTIWGDLPLDEEAGLGYYYLEARFMDVPKEVQDRYAFGFGFQVAEYRKPEFVVDLSTDRQEYLAGETISATVATEFFFGGPVTGAQVEWTAFSQDAYFNYQGSPGDPWYSFNDFTGWDTRDQGRFGGVVASGSGKTDGQGRYSFEVPADISDRLQSQGFTIDVRVIDLSNQEVADSMGVVVHKGLIYPGVASTNYVATVGQPAEVALITVDWESKPVPGQVVSVAINQAQWRTVQEQGEDGRFYWVSQVQETPVLSKRVTTGADGKASFTWVPESGGEYKINASVIDSQGNRVRSSTFTWASDEPDTYVSWQVDNNDRIELVADKPLYEVGETARVLVPHPFQGPVEALITVERGEIIETRQITLQGNSEVLEFPIEPGYVPDVFVSAVIAKGQGTTGDDLGSFKVGLVQLPVDTAPKELQVTLTPSKTELKPGEVVTFTVQIKDSENQPVEGEFSLALVDKALLALVQDQQTTLLDTFYRQRGLGVQTAATLVMNLDRLNQQLQEGAKGGGGGDGGMAMVDVRSEFEDTALWEPAVITDADGQAVVSVKLPDNLTTWRLDGRAVTVDTKVGQATVEIQTTLPLLVRPVLPRFFTAADKAEIGAVVLNNTEEERTVSVELSGSGLTTSAPAVQEIAVPAGAQVKVNWPVEVDTPPSHAAVGQVTVRFTAVEGEGGRPVAGGLSDAVELVLPVYRYSSPETVATAGTVALGEERLEVIVVPPDVDPTQGELQVRLDPSLAAGMVESLNWLEAFPYECTEQIVSQFLPNIASYRAVVALDLSRPELETNLREQLTSAIQKLSRRQNPDGGWGWWGGEESNAFVSAYVVYGLVEAQNAGFTVDELVLARGVDYLKRQLQPVEDLQSYELNTQAFILYVLAEAGEGDTGRTVALYDVRERLGHYGRAWLALAFGVLAEESDSSAQTRLETLIDDLSGAAIVSATGAHWEEQSTDYWTMNTDTRSTSLALDVLARYDPENGLAPNVVRWLMVARQDGRWETTQENVWAIIALTDWMQATGELEGDYSYHVDLNTQIIEEGVVNSGNVDQPVDLRVAVEELLLDTANALTIARFATADQSGDGQLYYTAHLNYYLPAAGLEALDRGIVVDRQYTLVDPVTGKQREPQGPVDGAAVGDTVQVTLTLVLPSDAYYLAVESPLPAGAEAIDPSLATTSQVYETGELVSTEAGSNPWWYWTPTTTELRDEKVVLFASYLPAGTYEFTYQMRASLPGEFQTLPVVAYQMYFPEVWGRSAGGVFTIGEE